jgi:hypothetical protein
MNHIGIAIVLIREHVANIDAAIASLERLHATRQERKMRGHSYTPPVHQTCNITGEPCYTRQPSKNKPGCPCAECVAYAEEMQLASTDNKVSPDFKNSASGKN